MNDSTQEIWPPRTQGDPSGHGDLDEHAADRREGRFLRHALQPVSLVVRRVDALCTAAMSGMTRHLKRRFRFYIQQ